MIGKVCLMIGMVKIVGEIGPGRIVRAPREIRVIFPTRIVSMRVGIMLQPRVDRIHFVLEVLDEFVKLDTL